MQNSPKWVAARDELERPNAARLYDYYLGGAHNFAVDREFAAGSPALIPTAEMIQHSRAFLRRAVRACVANGIRQFLDLGSGIPTAGNVHEVAHQDDPTCRVVYVDNDCATVAHGRTMLRDVANVAFAEADIRDAKAVLTSAEVTSLLDLSQPVAVLMVAILPYVFDDDSPVDVVAAYRDGIVPGSHLVLSHLTADNRPELVEELVRVSTQRMARITARSKAEVEPLLEGFDLLEPGLVLVSTWRGDGVPETDAETVSYGAVGVKR
ncbi:SAM-dependent methyltransferase [Saccharothrix violaceirubra]|uniref:S-adenosyl methyltransferase n=1 Tax=Saccharothrix violaceirubra TaxID=413306 RepID=A0A7W7SYG5_9PSEU|nr:SAM-dependent methyltransferase [Saccharothrix violaceirubra]MBB4963218.1 hypothetical protein [Saccharothrix violaceirubra]